MLTNMKEFIHYFLQILPEFLSSEPIIYILSLVILGYLFSWVFKIVRLH